MDGKRHAESETSQAQTGHTPTTMPGQQGGIPNPTEREEIPPCSGQTQIEPGREESTGGKSPTFFGMYQTNLGVGEMYLTHKKDRHCPKT